MHPADFQNLKEINMYKLTLKTVKKQKTNRNNLSKFKSILIWNQIKLYIIVY